LQAGAPKGTGIVTDDGEDGSTNRGSISDDRTIEDPAIPPIDLDIPEGGNAKKRMLEARERRDR